MSTSQPMKPRRIHRTVTAALGALLLGVGLYVLFCSSADVARYAAGGGLAVLGGNAIYAALRGTEPWLSKIGPMP